MCQLSVKLSFPLIYSWFCVFRPHDYSADGFNDWAFMTTHSWDEDPTGEWVLEIENTSANSNYGKFHPESFNILLVKFIS